MLSIGKLPSASNTAVCYLEVIANGRDDYYLAAGEAPGRWMGSAAAHLGLGGSVTPEDLRAMLGGLHPRSGEKLVGWRTVAGFDLTLSAPKSVSLLWALGGEEVATQVMAAHDAAVEAAVSYFQDAACLVRRGGVPARTSRESDPNLHTHLVTGNLTLGEDGRWSALHSADLYRHGRTAGFVYQSVLRHHDLVRQLVYAARGRPSTLMNLRVRRRRRRPRPVARHLSTSATASALPASSSTATSGSCRVGETETTRPRSWCPTPSGTTWADTTSPLSNRSGGTLATPRQQCLCLRPGGRRRDRWRTRLRS